MARPSLACGLVRLHIYGPDAATSRGYLSGLNATGTYSKAWADSSLSFDAQGLEAAMVADTAMLDEAFAVVELDVGGVWTPITTPYLLAPGEGTVIGPAEGSALEFRPVAVGALKGLLDELIVLPNECVDDSPTLRYACGIEGNRYLGWQSKGFDASGWNSADVWTVTSAKDGEPENWDPSATGAEWVYRDSDEGGLTLVRFGEFEVTELSTHRFIASADEEFKVYLDGPNMGGVIIDSTADETGYTEMHDWAKNKRLEPGTYHVSAEFTSVNSEGGDGNDSIRFACGTVDEKGLILAPSIISSSSAKVWRQAKSDTRPGFTVGEVMRRLLQDNSDLGATAADILLDNKTFSDSTDSASVAWDDGQEWVWPLGTTLSSAFSDLSEDADLDLSPDFEFEAWNDRGSDLSSSVAFVPGASPATATMNIVEHGYTSEPFGPTRYLTLSQDGYDIVIGTSAEVGTRPRFGFFESGASASIGRARRNARAAIRQNGVLRRWFKTRIIAVTGAIPFVSFTVCDLVSGRDIDATAEVQEVTAITWQQPGDGEAQSVQFTIESTEP